MYRMLTIKTPSKLLQFKWNLQNYDVHQWGVIILSYPNCNDVWSNPIINFRHGWIITFNINSGLYGLSISYYQLIPVCKTALEHRILMCIACSYFVKDNENTLLKLCTLINQHCGWFPLHILAWKHYMQILPLLNHCNAFWNLDNP